MNVDKALIQRLSNLSKLQFDEAETTEIINDLNNIIGFIDQLKAVNVDGLEPLIHLSDQTNVLRPDVIKMEITHEEALKNAPVADSDYFKVPRVLKKK
jgi:aspartyl-tRNA(Asn)/glutamyl-tRNA(Gln) amidotransferase subunit C